MIEKIERMIDSFYHLRETYAEKEESKTFYYQELNRLEEMIEQNYLYLEYVFLEQYYSEYAFVSFELGKYKDFFRLIMEAGRFGYDVKSLKETLYEVFVEPNLNECRENYERNSSELNYISKNYDSISFDALKYYILPTEEENIFCVMDKNSGMLLELVDNDYRSFRGFFTRNRFSDILVIDSWTDLKRCMAYCQRFQKQCYYIVKDVNKFFSYLQTFLLPKEILDILVVSETEEKLFEYLKNERKSIPWNIIAYTEEKERMIHNLEEIRDLRLKEKRSTKPLLSICIPSYNRGESAWTTVKELLSFPLDYEMEVIVSNNGSDNETAKYYRKIRSIEDSRLIYHEFEHNKGYIENSCKVASLASGEFLMLLSDEDSLYEEGLYDILDLIQKKGDSLAIIKTLHHVQGSVEAGYAEKGREAYGRFMLTSNYLSMNIFKSELLKPFIYYPQQHMDNEACLYYSHMCWELFVMQHGDVISTEIFFVKEGNPIQVDNTDRTIIRNEEINYYQTIESRLNQHKGFMEIIKTLEIGKENFDMLIMMYRNLCKKTIYLAQMSLVLFYQNQDWNPKLDEVSKFCKNNLMELGEFIDENTLSQECTFIDSIRNNIMV